MLPKKRRASSALKPLKPLKLLKTLKLPKVLKAQESYLQSFQVTQYIYNSLAAVVIQPLEALVALVAIQQTVLSEDIKAWPSSQIADIEDKLGAVFEAYGKTAKDEADKVDETKLPELLAKEVARMGLPTIPIIQEPMTAFLNQILKSLTF